MVESAWASAGLSGPTRRSVGGAVSGEADVGGGGEGLSWPLHEVSARSVNRTNTRTGFGFLNIDLAFDMERHGRTFPNANHGNTGARYEHLPRDT